MEKEEKLTTIARSEVKLYMYIYIYLNQVKTKKNKKTLRNYQIEKLTI